MEVDLQKLSIPKFYAGRHVLITGGSGFIGKVLVEKIVRSCPDVAGVHLLLREKKGVPAGDRIKKITHIPLFDKLRKDNPQFEEKLHTIGGDISLPGLGISPENREFLVKNVSIVFHVAATVRFDDPLARAVMINVRGTRDLALLATEMHKLAVFVHVSTTYCNTDKQVIEEKLYPPHGGWRTILDLAEKFDSRIIDFITPKIMGKLPNTYTFTKSLAEHCVHDVLAGKPLVIVRPSIVISTLRDPIEGWIDNYNGPVGLLVGCGKGILHINLARRENIADYMPVDVLVKFFLVAAFKHGSQKIVEKTPPVYNCSSATVKPVKTGYMAQMAEESMLITPLNDVLWIPAGMTTESTNVLLIATIFLHMIPAYFVDAALRWQGKKRKGPRLVRLQRQIFAAQFALAYFLLNGWVFKNDKFLQLDKEVPSKDRDAFSFDFMDIDVEEYFRSMTLGGRRYLLKEKDEDLPAARRHLRRLLLITKTLKAFGVLLLAWLIFTVSSKWLLTTGSTETMLTSL